MSVGDYTRCPNCGQILMDPQTHFCPAFRSSEREGCRPATPLTETDVRRIVRDELDREKAQRNTPEATS